MVRFQFVRSASLCLSLLGSFVNFALAVQLLSAWRSLKWESESEWEGSETSWRGDGLTLVWGLLSAYFAIAATVSFIGFMGIVKSIPSFVRFYRDYSIADFTFCSFFTLVGAYAAFRTSIRTVVCEELSRQPDLLRGTAEMGLNLENCELWFDRAVLAFLMFMVVFIVIRLHFLIALANYYCHLIRQNSSSLPIHTHWRSDDAQHHQTQHIYLLPRTSSLSTSTAKIIDGTDFLVYAPVPLGSMSSQEAQDIRTSATKAWISRTEPGSSSSSSSSSQSGRSSRHGHGHGHRRHGSTGAACTGRINLPVKADEGLLPAYEDSLPPFKA